MFKKPFSFSGRIRRLEYGLSLIIYTIPAIFLNFQGESGDGDTQIISLLCYIPLLWFLGAQGAKRCHDRGNTGWFQIIPGYVFWMLFAKGYPDDNKYGEDPKQNINSTKQLDTGIDISERT